MTASSTIAPSENTFVRDENILAVKSFVEEESHESLDVLGLLVRTLRGRWRKLIACCLPLAIFFAALGYLLTDPIYESVGLLRVSANKPSILYEDQNSSNAKHYDSFVDAQVSILGSYPVKTRALTLLESEGIKMERVDDFDQLMTINRNKSLLTVKARHSDPAVAQTVLNSLLDSYLTDQYERLNHRRTFRETELINREQELLEQIKNVVNEMLVVGGEYGLESIVQAHLAKVRELEKLDGKLSELEDALFELKTVGTVVNLDQVDVEMKRALVLDQALAEMIYDQAKRKAKLVALKEQYQPGHRLITTSEAELSVMESAIKTRSEQITTLGRTGLHSQDEEKSVEEMQFLKEQLIKRRKNLELSAKDLNEKLVRLEFLNGEREALRVLLDETRRILDEVRVESRDSLPGLVEVVSRGVMSEAPLRDKRPALSGLLGACGFGFSLVLILASLIYQARLRYSDDLHAVTRGESVLGYFTPDEAIVSSANADKLRNAIQLLDLKPKADPEYARVITLSGICHRSQASDVAQALGNSFSLCGMKTLVVDADLISGRLTSALRYEGHKGWKDVLARDNKDAICQWDDFDFMPVGGSSGLDDRQISVQDVREVFATLTADYDVIIADLGNAQATLSSRFIQSIADLNLCTVSPGASLGKIRKVVTDIRQTAPGRLRMLMTNTLREDPLLAFS